MMISYVGFLDELCRMRELQTLKGKVESAAKLKGYDPDDVNNYNYTI